jgi:exonuclease SbcC
MLDETAAEAWAQEYEQDVLKKNEIESNIKQLRDNQLKLKEEIEKDETLSEILEALREKQKQRDELQINLGKLNQQLDNNTQNIQNKEEKERILTLKEGNNKKWYELNALIGDASGNRFANFAQDLTLQSLIAITNKNLSLLTDRYLLVPTRIEETLSVYDTYQGDTIRAINTLSGGETFIVSLAMAVSLSELAAKNVQIQSIFIDEGFGSLDADSLEQAMSTLESWQSSSNKTIGIISHVASLKERISTQIQLERDHKGHSQLNIVG